MDHAGTPNVPHVVLTSAYDPVGDCTSLTARAAGSGERWLHGATQSGRRRPPCSPAARPFHSAAFFRQSEAMSDLLYRQLVLFEPLAVSRAGGRLLACHGL